MSGAAIAGGIAAPGAAGKKFQLDRRVLLAGTSLLGLLAAGIYGYNYAITGQYIETTDDAYVGGDVADLAPQVSGLIGQVAVADNQPVHAGDLLVKIDDRMFRAALQKAEAAVAAAQASLANLDATQSLQLALIHEAQADILAQSAQSSLARSNQTRYRVLAASAAGSEQQAQTADADAAQAAAALDKARDALAAAQAELAVIGTQKQQASAALAGALADAASAQLNLGYTEIRAPFDGVVGNRSAHRGGYATAGAPLVSLVPATGLWVDANFKEDQLANMHPGEPVDIVADVLPGRKITGHVASLAPASGAVFSILPAENATGNFTKIVQRVPVRISLDGDAATLGLLRAGLSVTAAVDTK